MSAYIKAGLTPKQMIASGILRANEAGLPTSQVITYEVAQEIAAHVLETLAAWGCGGLDTEQQDNT